jgi:hypothetical protein
MNDYQIAALVVLMVTIAVVVFERVQTYRENKRAVAYARARAAHPAGKGLTQG